MHYTRIIVGIIFVPQVTTGHYKLILIQTVGKLFVSIIRRVSVYFCYYFLARLGSMCYLTIFKSFINVILATFYLSLKRRGQGHQGAEEDDIFLLKYSLYIHTPLPICIVL